MLQTLNQTHQSPSRRQLAVPLLLQFALYCLYALFTVQCLILVRYRVLGNCKRNFLSGCSCYLCRIYVYKLICMFCELNDDDDEDDESKQTSQWQIIFQ